MPPGRTGRAAVEIIGDVSNFGSQVERELNSELRGVDVDVSGVASQISAGVDAGVKDAGEKLKGLDADAKAGLKGVGEEAAKAGQGIGAGVEEGTGRARSALGRFVAGGAAAGAGFALSFGVVPKILGGVGRAAGAAFGAGLKGLSVASAASTASSLVVALAPAVGALGVLAPAMIANKIAAGTLKLALMGVSDAVSAGITGDTEAFNAALEQMPAPAQAAIKEIVGLKDQLMNVREAVQGQFFEPLVGTLKPLGERYLPLASSQLGAISSGFGKAAAESAKFLATPAAVNSVTASLRDSGTAINQVTEGVPGLIRAFLPLWEVGSSFLPGLTYGFGDLTDRVAGFMERARETGQLQKFISGGLSVLGELGGILADVGSILTSVFQAASGSAGDVLGVAGQALDQFAAFLNTAEGTATLTAIFQTLSQASQIFGTALGIVLPIVAQLVTVLASALQPVLPVIAGLVKQLAPVLAQVGQAMGAILGPAIGVVVQLLSTLIPVIMPIVSALMGALMPVITALSPVITALGQVIATILGAALRALMPLFTALLPVVSQLLVSVLTPLVPVLGLVGELFLALMPALTPLIGLVVALLTRAMKPLSVIIPIVATVLQVLIRAVIALVGPIAEAIGWVASFLAKLLTAKSVGATVTGVWNGLKATASAVFGFIRTYITVQWNLIKAVSSAVWSFIKTYITVQINIVKAVFRTIGAAVNQVVGFFGRMRSGAASALTAMRNAVSSAVGQVVGFFGRLASGANDKINNMIGVVRGIGGRIRSAVGNLAGLLTSAGRNVIQGLIDGIENKLGALRDKAASAASTIRDLFPFSPAREGPLSGRGSPEIAGGKIATMVATGLDKRIPAIRAAAMRAASTAQIGRQGALDVQGRGILQAALGSRNPSPALPPTRATGSPSVTFAAGSIIINFHGPVTADRAYAAGQAAVRGLAAAFDARDVRTTVRSL